MEAHSYRSPAVTQPMLENSPLPGCKGDLEAVTSASYDLKEEIFSDVRSTPSPASLVPVTPTPKFVEGNLVSHRDFMESSVIFSILGCLAGFFWEAMLNCLPTICTQLFPGRTTFSDELTGLFNTAILLAAVILLFMSPLRRSILLTATTTITLCSLLVGVLCYLPSGYSWIPAAITAVCFIAGVATGFTESSTFAYALCFHSTRFTGCFSIGFGLSGILSVVCWMIWSRMIWPDMDVTSARKSIMAQQLTSAFIGILSLVAFIRFTHIESYKVWKAELPKGPSMSALLSPLSSRMSKDLEDANDEEAITPLWDVIVATKTCQFHLGLVLFITFLVVPNLVPLVLLGNSHQQDILVGIYQVTDFVGRFGANMDHFFPWVKLRDDWLVALSYCRLIFVAMALRLIVEPLSFGMGSFGIQVIFTAAIGITNGWFLTLFMMSLAKPLTKDHDKGRATAVCVITQLSGMVIGLYLANLAKVVFLAARS